MWWRIKPESFYVNLSQAPVRFIFYNASLLSRPLEHKEKTRDTRGGAEVVKKISPIAWQNINLYGRYEFQKPPHLPPLTEQELFKCFSNELAEELNAE